MLKTLSSGGSAQLLQRMQRSNSGKGLARSKQAARDGVLVVSADSSSEQEHQNSSDSLPLLVCQQSHAYTTTSSGMSSWQTKTLSAINELTKWTVSAAVFGVLLWQHNEFAAWCVVGAVFSSFTCKVLKHVINQERPDNAQKSDPGMPSSHANSLNFLSVYAALSLNFHTRSHPTAVALAGCTVLLGAFLTWLRVRLGYHTRPQVLVGAGLGAGTAAGWFFMGTNWALPALQQSSAGLPALYTVTLLAMAAFGVKNVLSWAKERKQQQQRQRQQQGQKQRQELLALRGKLDEMQQPVQPAQQQDVPRTALMAQPAAAGWAN